MFWIDNRQPAANFTFPFYLYVVKWALYIQTHCLRQQHIIMRVCAFHAFSEFLAAYPISLYHYRVFLILSVFRISVRLVPLLQRLLTFFDRHTTSFWGEGNSHMSHFDTSKHIKLPIPNKKVTNYCRRSEYVKRRLDKRTKTFCSLVMDR